MKVKGWLVVAALVGGLTVWGWAGHLPVYPSPAPMGPAVTVVHVHQPAAAPAASHAAHPVRALHGAHRVLRPRRLGRLFRPSRWLPWWLRG